MRQAKSVQVPTEVTAVLVCGMPRYQEPQTRPAAYTPGRCVYTEHDGLGLFRCEKLIDEGWLCDEHKLRPVYRKLGTSSQGEISLRPTQLEQEILLKGGTRIGSHLHLMKATISKADGSEAFPDRWNPDLGKFLAELEVPVKVGEPLDEAWES